MDENKSQDICKYCNFILYVLKIHLNVMDYMQGCNRGKTGSELLDLERNELDVIPIADRNTNLV